MAEDNNLLFHAKGNSFQSEPLPKIIRNLVKLQGLQERQRGLSNPVVSKLQPDCGVILGSQIGERDKRLGNRSQDYPSGGKNAPGRVSELKYQRKRIQSYAK